MKPTTRTQDGASVYITPNRRQGLVSIAVDRWPIEDATPKQCAAFRTLAIAEWIEYVVIKTGKRVGTAFMDSPTYWQLWTTQEREIIVLEEIDRIEREIR